MKNKDKLITNGTVLARHGDDYRIKLEGIVEVQILATMANKFRVPRKIGRGTSKPRIMEGDRVIVAISPNQTVIKRGIIIGFKN